MKKIVTFFKQPTRIYRSIVYRLLNSIAKFLSDETYLKYRWFITFDKKLNFSNPKSFNEKLQWLKLNNRQPLFTKLVDKFEVKEYVRNIIGDDYIIPTIAIYDQAENINFDALPEQFVLKCTHDSGGIVICTDKSKLNKENAIKKLKKGLENNFFLINREWPYKNVKPRIIAERYISEIDGDLRDYKFFCFNGIPKFLYVASDRFKEGEETKFDFFDMDFNHLPIINGHPNSKMPIKKPKGFELMVELAQKLSAGMIHVRVDFYDVNGKIYFGEMTFFHMSGLTKFEPQEWDLKFGEYIHLPNEENK